MTLAISVILLAILLLYCGIEGRSLKHAIVGQAVAGGTGQVTQ